MFSMAAIAMLESRPAAAYTNYVEWTDFSQAHQVGDLRSVRRSFDSSGS